MSLNRRNDDPTDFSGVNPYLGVVPFKPTKKPKDSKTNAATGASAAGVRAFTAQAVAFYFRAPVKAFFRTRVDYLAYARNLQQHNAAGNLTWWRGTTPGVISYAVRQYGWKVFPEQILPPLFANVAVGAVLYTSYLQILGILHEESSHATKRVYPPPSPLETFSAGWLAGSFQSLLAAPLDAIQIRYERSDYVNQKGSPPSMWQYSREKLREIGIRGIFAGWGISFLKDSFGSGVFFGVFEYVKAQSYYDFVRWYYGGLDEEVVDDLVRKRPEKKKSADQEQTTLIRHHHHHHHNNHHNSTSDPPNQQTIKPHYAIEPGFLMLAGISASIAQQTILYPLSHVQTKHWEHLESLDKQARRFRRDHQQSHTHSRDWRMFSAYYHAYQATWKNCLSDAQAQSQNQGQVSNLSPSGTDNAPKSVQAISSTSTKNTFTLMRRYLYRGFWWNTIRQVPSTSAGLIIFELVRRKYGLSNEEIRITKDGYDILLN